MRVLLLLVLLLAGLRPGLAAELKLATWNLEWLTLKQAGDPALPHDVRPKSAADIAIMRGYAQQLDADVVAFQEVDGPEVAARVFPAERYALHFTADRVVQRVGFAVRRAIPFTANPDLTALDIDPGAPFRLRSGADITLRVGGNLLRLLNVHLKTGCREDRLTGSARPQCDQLRRQLVPIQGWIAERRREGAGFVLMGDFNRWMDGADATRGFYAGLAASGPLVRATEGRSSGCWGGGGFIDHIIAGGPARGWLVPESLRVLVYRETGFAWKERLSDHCPISARFRLPD